MKNNRKEFKKNARGNISRHYWLYVFICVVAAYLGTEQVRTFRFLDVFSIGQNTNAALLVRGIDPALTDLIDTINRSFLSKVGKIPELGTTNGVFALIYRTIAGGTISNYLIHMINSLTHSTQAGPVVLMVLAASLHIVFWLFVVQCLAVVNRRFFVEGKQYEKVPFERYLFFIRERKWWNVVKTLFLKNVMWFLWALTIVGGFIKHYSYLLVPYILAENPTVSGTQAITLSRKMMDGRKKEAFMISLSLLGWYVLDVLTLGISNIFWTNSYRIAIFSEFYISVRAGYLTQHPSETAIFNNRYLYEYAPQPLLDKAYASEIKDLKQMDPIENVYTGFKGFLERNFGLVFRLSKKEKAYEQYNFSRWDLESAKEQIERREYPVRLSPIPEIQKRHRLRYLYPARNYSVTSVLLLFFFMSFVGWCWEVSLHLINNGQFVDRGVLHLPWLPIYGFGCVFILLLLRRWRQEPIKEFLYAVILCGFVEYFTSVYLQAVYHTEWWSYKGYFLNLNGRICAEGLLVFGLGGMAFVYIIAPLLDNWFRKIGLEKLSKLAIVLLVVFVADVIYSHFYPNEGQGVTTGTVVNEHTKKADG